MFSSNGIVREKEKYSLCAFNHVKYIPCLPMRLEMTGRICTHLVSRTQTAGIIQESIPNYFGFPAMESTLEK